MNFFFLGGDFSVVGELVLRVGGLFVFGLVEVLEVESRVIVRFEVLYVFDSFVCSFFGDVEF